MTTKNCLKTIVKLRDALKTCKLISHRTGNTLYYDQDVVRKALRSANAVITKGSTL